mgnify:CR=1 FL=1
MPNVESPEDQLLVQNIDVNCSDIDAEHGFDHAKGFTVYWDKHPFTVKPGGTRIMPRYVALHFAKHLANHILIKRSEQENRPTLLTDRKARTDLMDEIILGVESYLHADENEEPVVREPKDFSEPLPVTMTEDAKEKSDAKKGDSKKSTPETKEQNKGWELAPNENKHTKNVDTATLIKEAADLGIELADDTPREKVIAALLSF